MNESRGDVIRKRWAFCPITGDLLILDSAQGVARSERAPFSRPLSDLDETMLVVTTSDMADYQRRYALDPLIKSREQLEFEEILRNRVRATVEEPCPRCKAPIMEYHTMQLRSADEGQVRMCGRGRGGGRKEQESQNAELQPPLSSGGSAGQLTVTTTRPCCAPADGVLRVPTVPLPIQHQQLRRGWRAAPL